MLLLRNRDGLCDVRGRATSNEAIVRYGVGKLVADIRIAGADLPDDRTGRILGDIAARQGQIHRTFVDVLDFDRRGLAGNETPAVGGGEREGDVRLGLMVETDTVLQLQLPADDLEGAVRQCR
jgi:hypothetical protein